MTKNLLIEHKNSLLIFSNHSSKKKKLRKFKKFKLHFFETMHKIYRRRKRSLDDDRDFNKMKYDVDYFLKENYTNNESIMRNFKRS